eukprot:1140334-Pelagomonas_calceolata.AAC.6
MTPCKTDCRASHRFKIFNQLYFISHPPHPAALPFVAPCPVENIVKIRAGQGLIPFLVHNCGH